MKATQTTRIIEYIRTHPGCTGLELAIHLRIPNYRARISDARVDGHDILAYRDDEGVHRYRLVERPKVTTGEQVGWLA